MAYTGTERTICPCLFRATIALLYCGGGNLIVKLKGISLAVSSRIGCLVVFTPYRFEKT